MPFVSLRFFGLDGEMSAADLAAGGRLIQIGLAANEGLDGQWATGALDSFSCTINPGPCRWERQAEAVHGIRQEEVARAIPAEQADELLVEWLTDRGMSTSARSECIPVGFNVGAFDLPHMRAVLPRAHALMSARTVDLNALCFSLDGAAYDGSACTWREWKRLASAFGWHTVRQVNLDAEPHHARDDAQVHVHAWRFLRSAMRGEAMVMSYLVMPSSDAELVVGELLTRYSADDLARRSGVPVDVIEAWSRGGRARRLDYLQALRRLLV